MAFKTEFEFTLPKGFVDEHGNLHRKGVMRLATAKDEIIPLQDFRVKNNRAYLVIILLSRVITKLGDLKEGEVNLRKLFTVGPLFHGRRPGLHRIGNTSAQMTDRYPHSLLPVRKPLSVTLAHDSALFLQQFRACLERAPAGPRRRAYSLPKRDFRGNSRAILIVSEP